MSLKNLSICNLSHLNCDTTFIDTNRNLVAFFSVISHSTLLKLSIKKINEEPKPYCYLRECGTVRLERKGYDIETKRQSNGDYLHAVGYLKDRITESSSGIMSLTGYIYFTDIEDRNNKIFNKIYKNFSVPILSEWKDYIVEKLVRDGNVYPLRCITSRDEIPFECVGLYVSENKIEEIITSGLKQGEIKVNNSNEPSLLMDSIGGLDDYLNVFGETLASKIQQSFVPKFIPGQDTYTEFVNNYDDNIFATGIEMYEAQKSVVQSAVNCLNTEDVVFVIGEMGSGKTLQGAGIPYAHHAYKEGRGANSIILCPGHLKDKWKREIEKFVPNSKAFIVKSITDVVKLEPRLRNKKKIENTYVIISKEDAKISYEKRPAAIWSLSKDTYVCPECGQVLKKKIKGNYVDFDEMDMMKQNATNAKCTNKVKKWNESKRAYDIVECECDLWVPLNKDSKDEKWIKLGADGWIQRNHLLLIKNRLEIMKNTLGLDKKQKALLERLDKMVDEMNENDGVLKEIMRGTRRYSVAKYIKDHMNRIFDYCIIDECHEYKGNSIQGQAACDLIKASKKSIMLTGTLLNGYASGLFYLLYRTLPRILKKDGIEYNQEMEFVRRYGVTQTSCKNGKGGRIVNNEKALPGVSPLVFTKFLLNNAVFLSLSDMSEGLPDYEEIPLGIEMDDNLKQAYSAFEREFSYATSQFTSGAKKIMGRMVESMTSYADCPHIEVEIRNPDTDELVIKPEVLPKTIRNKDLATIELVKEKIANGEKVLIYYSWVNKTDIASTLIDLLKEEGIKAKELTSRIKQEDREDWIKKQSEDGMQVLICNPKLVETGLDLLEFTTILFYQMGYNLFTLRQASRRSWRLSQTKDIKVYFMYYKDTIQERAVTLMATKLQASMALEGKFSEEGLRAMSNNNDMLSQIAGSVVDGIKETVDENIFAAAKFMKSERKGPRQHYKTREMLNVDMDDFGMRRLFALRQLSLKSKKKVSTNVLNVINSSAELSKILVI